MQRPWFNFWVEKICWRRDRLPTPVFLGFPCGSAGKESACNVGDLGSIPGLGRSPGEGKGYPLQYSGPENSTDCIVREVAKSQTQLSDFHVFIQSSPTLSDPMDYHIPPSVGYSRQEHWSELPFLLQEIFPTQGLNAGLLHCRQTLYHLSYQGSHILT